MLSTSQRELETAVRPRGFFLAAVALFRMHCPAYAHHKIYDGHLIMRDVYYVLPFYGFSLRCFIYEFQIFRRCRKLNRRLGPGLERPYDPGSPIWVQAEVPTMPLARTEISSLGSKPMFTTFAATPSRCVMLVSSYLAANTRTFSSSHPHAASFLSRAPQHTIEGAHPERFCS